ncbi:Dam family site-specific DNA-(adenine-N6)-methyltransferase [Pragia fontium]|uniref:Site-specific DNA-methyltransferase (adenine-specific) n=1 Tax=Pragia fontium DSM 5563 = ATCC 49100 TaxID=1122977 RepID=A0AAJ5BGN5_9GAMM|nr:Dam family site-specific DNA-(adenine-N6)-methyltransferase [Pragia fontium]SFC49005.1 DNA adenine methylase [Pragia fontium DSM 5563 = ATCC 49100]
MTNRSCLKWPGGKGSIINEIKKHLPEGKRLIEPFVGAGNVFINTDYPEYILNDINGDLMGFYETLKQPPSQPDFINYFEDSFVDANEENMYYHRRNRFNDPLYASHKSELFLYLNRHCYNGMCRYNRKGEFNAPFGKYKSVYFPRRELGLFSEKLQKATLLCGDFERVIDLAGLDDVIYCDPPYIPVSGTSDFTAYHTAGFSLEDHDRLTLALIRAVSRGARVLISNSNACMSHFLYEPFAEIVTIETRRSIGAKASSRQPIKEILAVSKPHFVQWARQPGKQALFNELFLQKPLPGSVPTWGSVL